MPNQGIRLSAEQRAFKNFERLLSILTIYTNGYPTAEGNSCFWSWVAFDRDNKRVAANEGFHSDTCGISTNIAKFYALIEALSWIAVNEPETPVDVLCDLELAVKCVKGVWNTAKPEIMLLCQTARQYLARTNATLVWIPHKQNKAA